MATAVRGLRDRCLRLGLLVRQGVGLVGVLILVVRRRLLVGGRLVHGRLRLLLVWGLLVLGRLLLRVLLLRGCVTLQRGLLWVRLLLNRLLLVLLWMPLLLNGLLLVLRVWLLLRVRLLLRLLLRVREVGVRCAGVLGIRARRGLVGVVGLRSVRTGGVRLLR